MNAAALRLLQPLALIMVPLLIGGCALLNHIGYGEVSPYALLLAALLLIFGGNLDSGMRHRQWPALLAAVIVCLAAFVLSLWAKARLTEFGDYFGDFLLILAQLAGQDSRAWASALGDALLMILNLFLLFSMGLLKLVLSLGMRASRRFLGEKAGQTATTSGAYDFLPARGWRVLPCWAFARHLCVALTVMSVALLGLFWLELDGVWRCSWVPVLPAITLILFGEAAAYLGGIPGGQGVTTIEGGDAAGAVFASYEDVWCAMRDTWSDSWLARASQDPWKKRP